MPKNNWTREQTIVAFNLFCKIPFSKSSKSNPIVIKYAKIIGRSPSALNMKIGNFGRLDPELRKRGIVGLANGSKLEENIWDEFHDNWDNLVFESEKIISEFQDENIEKEDAVMIFPEGKEKMYSIKNRINQSFFRSAVLSAYDSQCCITGIKIPDLLVASHIIPWRENRERTNPKNGLCLNSLHDKAFDKGYITIDNNFKIQISKCIQEFYLEKPIISYFLNYNNRKISTPEKFLPGLDFLEYHRNNIFIK